VPATGLTRSTLRDLFMVTSSFINAVRRLLLRDRYGSKAPCPQKALHQLKMEPSRQKWNQEQQQGELVERLLLVQEARQLLVSMFEDLAHNCSWDGPQAWLRSAH
jgi:hypothetical protein